jgi:spermidine/putrescine transport system ATP-binding protein/putrescine transport system ATP-binding protein
LELDLPPNADVAIGARVLVAIRPERLMLSREAPAVPHAPGQVLSAAYLGDRNQFQVKIEGMRTPIAVVAQSGASFHAGDCVYLTWSPQSPLLLSAD